MQSGDAVVEQVQGETTSKVASMLTQLGGVLFSVETVQTAVERVSQLAVATLPGTTGAGVTLIDGRGQRTTAASSPLVGEADALQYAFGSGPCLSAWSEATVIRVDDLLTEKRWPEWTAAAAQLGVRSVLSAPLLAPTTSVGAIKVYAQRPGAYDAQAEEVLRMFADQAAVLLANMLTLSDARQLASDLGNALKSRDVIGQAKGVLMAQGAADEEAAFALLVSVSQRSNIKVHQVARQLIDSVLNRHTRASN